MVRTSHIISACLGAVLCAAILTPWSRPAPQSATTTPGSTSPAQQDGAAATVDEVPDHRTLLPTPDYRTAQFTPEMARNCLEVAEMVDPDMAARLEVLYQNDPAKFRILLATSGKRLLSLAELRDRDPKLFSLKMHEMQTDARVMQVGRDLRNAVERADETAIEALESELEVLLNMQFAFTIAARAEYLMRLENHVAQLKAEIDEMMEMHDLLIAERLEEIKCGDAPVQPSWQRNSTSYQFAAHFNPTFVAPHPASNPTNNDAGDPPPDE